MPWNRKPRVYKRELLEALQVGRQEYAVSLMALQAQAKWALRWKAEAKKLRAELAELTAPVSVEIKRGAPRAEVALSGAALEAGA